MIIPPEQVDRADWLEHNRSAWNERADGWDRMLDERVEERELELQRSVEAFDLRPGNRLLEAGCGPGHWAIGFAQRGASVTAIDLAPAMLAHAIRRAAEAGVEFETRDGDIIDRLAGDPDATYDAIHCRCMLQFTPDPVAVVKAFRRVLKPDGRLLVAVPGALSPIYSDSYRRFFEPTTNNRLVPWELERVLDALGWEIAGGWGGYRAGGNGVSNAFIEPDILAFPQRMQQAAATYWVTIAQVSG